MFSVTPSSKNPILSPIKNHPWESVATFNPSPVIHKKKLNLLYRAMSGVDHMISPSFRMSVIGCATEDGKGSFEDRRVLIAPEKEYEKFGLEDPRATTIDGVHYIFYTALGGFPFSADNIKVAVAVTRDLKNIDERHLVTPFNAKAMTLFPEKINGEYVAILAVNTDRKPSDICIARFKKIEDMWSKKYWDSWYAHLDDHKLHIQRHEHDQVEVGAAPLKTKDGWLLIYSHIQGYGTDAPVFGVEALLLDSENPLQIISRTDSPFMVPEDHYERIGLISNIVFPSGALLRKNIVELYYGASDTHSAVASIPLKPLLNALVNPGHLVKRYAKNPILAPRPGFEWEEGGVFNPAAIELEGNTYILYRAVTKSNVSVIGLAVSSDGFVIDERLDEPVYRGRADFEISASGEDSNYGTEDPRVVKIGKRLYMTYTGYDGKVPRVVMSSISVSDFLKRKFDAWSEPFALTPDTIDDKDACIFPDKIDGKFMVIHRIGEHICADYIESLDDPQPLSKCIDVMGPRRGMWDGWKIGAATPPVKTEEGWLLLYHGVSAERVYSVGAVLLDLKNPTIVKARSAAPIFKPETQYELNGVVSRVVFPCGIVVKENACRIYYGGGDYVTGVATFGIADILKTLQAAG